MFIFATLVEMAFPGTLGDVGVDPVRPFRSKTLTALLVLLLLATIMVVLILPDVDLPDAAFQRNGSLQTSRAASSHAPRASVSPALQRFLFRFESACALLNQVRVTHTPYHEDSPSLHETLRC